MRILVAPEETIVEPSLTDPEWQLVMSEDEPLLLTNGKIQRSREIKLNTEAHLFSIGSISTRQSNRYMTNYTMDIGGQLLLSEVQVFGVPGECVCT